jgi:hypothetical protein
MTYAFISRSGSAGRSLEQAPDKQKIARELLRRGLADQELVLPHQAIVEFVAAATRPRSDLDGASLLAPRVAYREAEGLMRDFPELPPMYDTAW